MATTNKNISGRLKSRAIKLISPLLLLLLVALSSCVDNKETYKPTPTPPKEGNTDVFFEISVPQSQAPQSYALDFEDENQIKTVEILLFKIDPNNGSKTYTGTPYYCDNVETGAGVDSDKKYFVVSLPIGGPYDIVMLANSRIVTDSLLLDSAPTTTKKDELLKLFVLTHEAKWISTVGDNKYVPIPMWGELNNQEISENLKFDTRLMRMLAKIDVALSSPEAISNLTLNEVYLANANTCGQIVPESEKLLAGDPTLVTNNPTAKQSFKYDSSEASVAEKEFKGVIYTFEAENTAASSLSTAICLILKGVYSGDNKEYFYRIDFGSKDSNGLIKYLDILRNMEYIVNISKVNGPGYSSYEDAIKSPSSNIEANLVVWDHNELPIVVFDSNNMLGFSKDVVVVNYLPSKSDQLKVRTDYPSGWKIDKIVGAADELIDWLSISPSSGLKDETANLSFTFGVNNSGEERVCYVQFSAGALRHIVVVKQLSFSRIGSVVWANYIGADFTSITIKDDLGNSYISAVDASGVLVDGAGTAQPINVDGVITKVIATYKGYVLDVPVANYSYNKPVMALTITDKSLIGEPIHLNLIREAENLSGDYIQVDDIDLVGFDNWVPIGGGVTGFSGSYDGGDGYGDKGFIIKNLKINRPTEDAVGLFGKIVFSTSGSIKRIHIGEGSSIIGGRTVGGICGLNQAAISSSSNSATVTGLNAVGGICGSNIGANAEIINCTNLVAGSVEGTAAGDGVVGGICGTNFSTISTSSNSATVTGSIEIGGICGKNHNGTISGCVNEATGSVTGSSHWVGGICGNNVILNGNSVISGCENKADITGGGLYLGGIAGGNNGLINNFCKNSGNILGDRDYIGGICGLNSGTISDCESTTEGTVVGDEAVTAAKYIGGICGRNTPEGVVERSTNAGEVVGLAKNSYLGGICGGNYGKIHDGCVNKGEVNNYGEGLHTGGVCGENNSSSAITGLIIDCDNEGTVNAEGSNVGGIVGLNSRADNYTTANVTGCKNRGAVNGAGLYIGGIVGHNYFYGVIEDCTNEATGIVSAEKSYIGGICGWDINPGGKFKGCVNEAKVTGLDDVGGICGASPEGLFEACINRGDVSGKTKTGGILGSSASEAIIDNCTNSGNISREGDLEGSVGGICGSTSRGTIRNGCSNTGKVTGSPDYSGDFESVGGICGRSLGSNVSNSSNSGVISGLNKGVGGIVGSNSDSGSITTCQNLIGGNVNGLESVGGVCGVNQGGRIESCTNAALIVAGYGTLGGSSAGGICGSNGIANNNPGGPISLNVNTGEVKSVVGSNGTYIGGICGVSYNSLISSCSNDASITGDLFIGGIVGAIYGSSGSSIYSCNNLYDGRVSGYSYIGGISGSSTAGSIQNSNNNGAITSTGDNVGGISGAASDITACSNNGAITSTGDNVGGIAGNGSTVSSSCNLAGGRVEGRNHVGGIGGLSGTYTACYNIGPVVGSSNVGAIYGGTTSMTDCYFGHLANDLDEATGCIKFGDSVWPNESMLGWEVSTATSEGPWKDDLGGWNGGNPIYPKLVTAP